VSDLIGRQVSVAVGASSPVVVRRWHGRPWFDTARRLDETVDIIRVLLEGGRSHHDGDRASSQGYRLRLHPPGAHITVAAFGPRAVAVAAEKADRVVLNMVTTQSVARIAQIVADRVRATSRPAPPLAVWLTAAVDPTPEAHLQMARARLGYLSAPGYADMIRQAGFGDLVDLALSGASLAEVEVSIPPEIDDVIGLAGTAEHLEKRIGQYRAAGADEVCLVPVTAGDPGGVRTLTALCPADSGTAP
jgi:probable F420-dependent oxidoreductase